MVQNILITGGCGFVGSSLAILFKEHYPEVRITCLDNLKRRGSELNVPRLKAKKIQFIHGDIRNKEDLAAVGDIDLILECSAEPSVLAGYNSSPEYLINTNLLGTINCLELARQRKADFIFLSSSRVYPIKTINDLPLQETSTRFKLKDSIKIQGTSSLGISEKFPMQGVRSLYGATKLASELFITEYINMYGIKGIINRCGVLTGPWQFGKVDQGVIVLWVAAHYWQKKLSYIGYGGKGKQVRDILHVIDLFNLLKIQIENINKYSGETFNVGGGHEISVSLKELTSLCEKYTNNTIKIDAIEENREADIPIYLSDCTKVIKATGWKPNIIPDTIVEEISQWIKENEKLLTGILT
jgi:CDP-paratose 2-epimerase